MESFGCVQKLAQPSLSRDSRKKQKQTTKNNIIKAQNCLW